MDQKLALELAQRLMSGELSAEQFAVQASSDTEWTRTAAVDIDRARRCGFAEVVLAQGKTPEDLCEIAAKIVAAEQDLLVTRLSETQSAALQASLPAGEWNAVAKTFRLQGPRPASREVVDSVAVVTAGTSDLPVAEEAAETLRWMRVPVEVIVDVGVAGPQRLLSRLDAIRKAGAVVVAAGMEGALPSVVAGHLDSPVIAVPTSIGYGANLGGVAALLSMLNSCAANVAVVNIDAGFKAGYLAGLIVTKRNA